MEDIVLNVIKKADKPLKSADVAKQAGLEKKDVDVSIKRLIKSDKIYSPKRCYYSIK